MSFFSLLMGHFQKTIMGHFHLIMTSYREKAKMFVLKNQWSVLLAWIFLIMIRGITVYYPSLFAHARSVPYYLSAYTGMYAVYSLSLLLSTNKSVAENKLLNLISSNGMCIYIYSDPLNYLITYLAVTLFGIRFLSNEIAVFLLLAVKLFATLFIPIAIGRIMRKLHLRYLY